MSTIDKHVDDLEPPTLTTLGEDTLLEILELCDSTTLSRLEVTSTVFSSRHNRLRQNVDTPLLSLPERAAAAVLRRHFALGAARPYEKGAGERHTQVLSLYEHGLLRPGVLHDVPLRAIEGEGEGWIQAYRRPYKHRTSDADLDAAIPSEARYVLLGAVSMTGARSTGRFANGSACQPLPSREELMDGSGLVFSTLAWGRRETVLKVTHHERSFGGGATTSSNLEDGVHWYRWPAHAIGFSSDPNLFLYYADSGIKRGLREVAPADRLSWNLETRSTGGWRAGLAYDLGDSGEWYKCCYYRM